MAKLNDQEVTTLLREYAGRSALREKAKGK
jgi:hypothetical protein